MIDPRTTDPLPAAATVIVVRECQLTITGGEHAGARHVFAAERLVIGADPRADFPIADTTMSKFHCELRIVDGRAYVRDLGSRNGTLLDHVPILDAPLRDGGVLTLGRTQLTFQVGTRDVALALSARDRFGRLRGGSVAMRRIYPLLEAAAAAPATTVLLQGESGTGKDLAAEMVHAQGARRDGPFVVVDCGAVPAHLLEAELFGHEAGAFTGASSARAGAFEAASGGTILLDEIGELALDLQSTLLRAIDKREIQRIGSTQRIPVDVRVIATTNRRLEAEVNARRFRSDLYYRLAVLVITMPPLRERLADLPVLIDAILGDIGDRSTDLARELASGALTAELARHAWPGNVRELRNYIEACLARQERPHLVANSAEPAIDIGQPLRAVRETWLRHVERRYLEELLAAHRNNVSAAARAAGVDRVHLHRLLAKHGLR